MPGIGFVLAAGLAGELGPPDPRRTLDQTCAYAGIVPRTYQTGGPDKPAIQGKVRPRCNRILKDWTVQSAMKLRLYGPPEIKDRIIRWNHNGQHGIYAAARRYLRLALTLTRHGMPYLPPPARAIDPDPGGTKPGIRTTAKRYFPLRQGYGGQVATSTRARSYGFDRRSRWLVLPVRRATGAGVVLKTTRSVFATSSHLSVEGTRSGPRPVCPETARSNRPVRIGTLPNTLKTTFKKALAKLWYY